LIDEIGSRSQRADDVITADRMGMHRRELFVAREDRGVGAHDPHNVCGYGGPHRICLLPGKIVKIVHILNTLCK